MFLYLTTCINNHFIIPADRERSEREKNRKKSDKRSAQIDGKIGVSHAPELHSECVHACLIDETLQLPHRQIYNFGIL